MTSAVMCVHPTQTSEECMVLMTENRLRHLPVMDGNKLLGLISIGDLVKSIIPTRSSQSSNSSTTSRASAADQGDGAGSF